jgi:hypothetical protein
MADLSKIYLYRMTHIENIPHVLQNGITHVDSANKNPDFVPIGDSSLISSRNSFLMPNGRLMGDYIPFYFGPRMPMLYVIQFGRNGVSKTEPSNVVYCVTSVSQIIKRQLDFVFTDGHAIAGLSSFYYPKSVERIEDIIDRNAISSHYWKSENDLDLKRRMEAEFLVLGDIPASAIIGYFIYNVEAKERMIKFGIEEKQLEIRPNYYF